MYNEERNQKIVFSGVQPSGVLTLGNYLGAIKNWVSMQNSYSCIFCIVDLHAITNPQSIDNLADNILNAAAFYIASGLDPDKVTIFQQSRVPEHAELAWILATQTPTGWLSRMTQFKSKSDNTTDPFLGLYSYPVLMAADILLYNADLVPVGEDQVQHIELTRDIASAFNRNFGVKHFKLPSVVINQDAKRIMSLKDASKKMSKSDPSDASRINLSDSNDVISFKTQRAKTDSFESIWFDEMQRPEVSNLIRIFAACTENTVQEIVSQYGDYNMSKFKNALAEALVHNISPIRDKAACLMQDKKELLKILEEGAAKAKSLAATNLKKIYDIVGLSL